MGDSSEEVVWQPSLFSAAEPVEIDVTFSSVERLQLDDESWADHVPRWVSGADRLFAEVLVSQDWGQRSRHMYDRRVLEPRLTSSWNLESGAPLEPPILEAIRTTLSARYDRVFDSVGFNLYRDGNDSVAWHGDRIREEIADPVVALVCLGEARRFLLRPKGGGASRAVLLGGGDLFVMGGRSQRSWEHSVPKVAKAGPRISIAYRHGLDPRVYAGKRTEPRS